MINFELTFSLWQVRTSIYEKEILGKTERTKKKENIVNEKKTDISFYFLRPK